MGLDPGFPNPPPGAACTLCESTLFSGITPLTVLAKVRDVVVCPGGPPVTIDGDITLTQIAACQWLGNVGPIAYFWLLQAGSSIFTINSGLVVFFGQTILSNCIDSFVNNQLVCNLPFTAAIGGTAEMFWGPDL